MNKDTATSRQPINDSGKRRQHAAPGPRHPSTSPTPRPSVNKFELIPHKTPDSASFPSFLAVLLPSHIPSTTRALHLSRISYPHRLYPTRFASTFTMSDSFTTKQVAEHASVDNGLYIIVDGGVYKMDTFVDEHPGGAKILKRVGGKDASKQFWKVCWLQTCYSPVQRNKADIYESVPQRERTEEVCAEAEGRNGQGGGEAIDTNMIAQVHFRDEY